MVRPLFYVLDTMRQFCDHEQKSVPVISPRVTGDHFVNWSRQPALEVLRIPLHQPC